MLAVQGLTKKFGDVAAVDDISFEARAGSVFGLLGPNGAGKSTTINCVSGLLAPSSGRITVGGADIATEARRARQALGIVPQELALYEDLPAIDNLRYWGMAYGLRGADLAKRVQEVLGYIGLGDRARELPKTFSGGMKRRLNFGCGIVHRPPLLLLDEPTVGVDPQSRSRLFEMIAAERDNGACILYTSHYMDEAERLCDAVAILDHGRLVSMGTVAELRAELKARDVLQLSGEFPQQGLHDAIAGLAERGPGDLEILAQDPHNLTLALSAGSQYLPAIFQAVSAAGGTVAETSLKSASLETLFLILTGKELRE